MNDRVFFRAVVAGIALALWVVGILVLWAVHSPERPSRVYIALTVVPVATPTPAPTPTPTPTAQPTPTPVPDYVRAGFGIGAYVQVAHTQGARLRFRAAPGLEAEVRFLAYEGEIFRIEEGPVEKDGYRWWYLVSPYSTKRAGWAAEAFLEPINISSSP